MQLQLRKEDGSAANKVDVSPVAFGREFNESLVHQVVVACMAHQRSGTKAQKTRAEVSGGGIKPWKQKGTGRARAGTIRSPLWRKGGKVFAAVPRDHSQKVNKKMYRGAMQVILSELVRQERLILVESFTMAAPKTKDLIARIKAIGVKEVLIVTNDWDMNLYLSARNVAGVEVRDVGSIDPVSLIKFDQVILTVPAMRQLEEVLK